MVVMDVSRQIQVVEDTKSANIRRTDTRDTRTNEWPHSSLFPKQREEKEGGACPSFIDTRQLQVGKTFSLSKCGTRIRAQASRTTLELKLGCACFDHDGIR